MMKKLWPNLGFISGLLSIPAAIFLMYATAGMILEGNWQQFAIAFFLFWLSIGAILGFGILSEG